jgi:hypothetical protein
MNYFVIFATDCGSGRIYSGPDPKSRGRLGSLKPGHVNSSGSTSDILLNRHIFIFRENFCDNNENYILLREKDSVFSSSEVASGIYFQPSCQELEHCTCLTNDCRAVGLPVVNPCHSIDLN